MRDTRDHLRIIARDCRNRTEPQRLKWPPADNPSFLSADAPLFPRPTRHFKHYFKLVKPRAAPPPGSGRPEFPHRTYRPSRMENLTATRPPPAERKKTGSLRRVFQHCREHSTTDARIKRYASTAFTHCCLNFYTASFTLVFPSHTATNK